VLALRRVDSPPALRSAALRLERLGAAAARATGAALSLAAVALLAGLVALA
jgi:hypothetical protein